MLRRGIDLVLLRPLFDAVCIMLYLSNHRGLDTAHLGIRADLLSISRQIKFDVEDPQTVYAYFADLPVPQIPTNAGGIFDIYIRQ